MGRKKLKRSTPPPRVINNSKQQNNKRKSNGISPATNQPQQKTVNQNVTTVTNQLHEPEGTTLQECSSDQQKSQINLNNSTSEDSDDSHRLQIDESDSNVTKELFLEKESVTNSDSQHEENGSETNYDSNNKEEQENMQTDSVVEEYPPNSFHHNLPTLEHVLTLCKWRDGKDPLDKDSRHKKKMASMPKLYLILLLTPICVQLKKSANTNLEKILNLFMEAMQIRMVTNSK